MKTNEELMNQIFEKSEIQIEKQTISKELLLKTYGIFLAQTMAKRDHNVGLIMHTGSVCFDVMLITYAAILTLLSNEADKEDVVGSFNVNDMVLYGQSKKSRYVFKGFIDGSEIGGERGKRFIRLAQSGDSFTYVPEKLWRNIEPYNGKSVSMDGRGIRRKSSIRDDFFVEVLNIETENIPSIIDASAVFVASREYTDYLVKNICLLFNGKRIDLLKLVTVSYFTEEGEYRYEGNTGKNEPTLKFTAKVSTARKLILSKGGNRHLGLSVLGEDSIYRGYSELPELIKRRSLQYVYMSSSLDCDFGMELTSDIDETEVFACTKEFLLENTSFENVEENAYVTDLATQVNTIIEKNNEVALVDGNGITAEKHRLFKKTILEIVRNSFSTEDKDSFIMLAYSLLKLFITAPFPMNRFSVAKSRSVLEVKSPYEKIEELKRLSESFPENLQKGALTIIDILKDILMQEEKSSGKYEWLRNFLVTHVGTKVAIVVPKAYYITLLTESGLFSKHMFKNKYLYTPNRFDGSQIYEYVVVLGDYEGKAFNAFRNNAATTTISVLYEGEKVGYEYKNKSFRNRTNLLQKKSTIIITTPDDDDIITQEEENANIFEKEMEEYISSVDLTNVCGGYRSNVGYDGAVNADVVAVAVFDDDTKAYLSKRYKGYVLEEATGIVKEIEALELCEGDSIVFTKNNDDTKDIVSSILDKLLCDGRLDSIAEENYRKSKLWKKALRDYMYANEYTARKVAELMIGDGATVHEQTILNWLDEDSHTVGPREVESIRHIGNITGDNELKENPESIFEACREVRSIRRKILEQVGVAIVEKLSGRVLKTGTDMESIFEKVDTLAEVKRVERIAKVNMTVPNGMVNRPISI